ncbi:MAG: heat shock protein HtpX, partial [Acidimicrobiaceae bacterium]|nr:heat shock protein HtpX [Acidimicrobiaceae bacterium]
MAAPHDLQSQIAANKRRTVYVMAGFTLLVTGVVAAFDLVFAGGPMIVAIAIVMALVMVWGGYFYSDRLAIAAAHGREADPVEYRQLHNLLEELCIGVGMPRPRVYIVDDPAPNAFATGRNPHHAAIAITTGLLALMNRDELEGVLSHELSHIHNYDILVGTIAVTLVGFIALLSDFGLRLLLFGRVGGRRRDSRDQTQIYVLALAIVFIVLAPVAATAMQFAISRRREALADVSGVLLTRNPDGLISALEKLRDNPAVIAHAPAATAHLWIESPLDTKSRDAHGWFNRLFMTHPPLQDRIDTLREVARTVP